MSEESKNTNTSKKSLLRYPVLSVRGIVVLFLSSLIPLASLLLSSAPSLTYLLLALFYFGFVLLITFERYKASVFFSKLDCECKAPSYMESGKREKIVFRFVSASKVRGSLSFRFIVCDTAVLKQTSLESTDFEPPLNQTKEVELIVRPIARGEFAMQSVTMRFVSRLGLSVWQYRIPGEFFGSVPIFPRVSETVVAELGSFRRSSLGGERADDAAGEGREFESLRRYNQGDDLRRVDWKRSAKGKGLLVKSYRLDTHQIVSVAIDCGRRMGNAVGERLQLEHATDATAHLIRASNLGDDQFGLFAFNDTVQCAVPVGKGNAHEKRIAQTIRGLSVGVLESDYELLHTWAHSNRRRSLLVVLTTLSNPTGLNKIVESLWSVRHRHLPLICAIADRDLSELTMSSASNLDEAYIISAAVQQSSQIERRLESIKHQGIESVYCDAADLSTRLKSKYYELKRLGRL